MEGPSGTKRARTKGTAAPRRPRPDPVKRVDLSRLFNSSYQINRYTNKFQHKRLIDPHFLDCNQMLRQGLQFPAFIQDQGLEQFVALQQPYYETLVKVFYTNLEIQDGKLTSMIAGKVLTIEEEHWEAVAGLQCEGAEIDLKKVKEIPNYNQHETVKDMLLDPSRVPPGRQLLAGKLKIEDRLLHFAIGKIIDPKSGNHARVTEDDTFLMWALKNNMKINWPHFIMHRMSERAEDISASLPYACLVTQFIKCYQAFTIDDGLTSVPEAHAFGPNSLIRMNLIKKNGVWRHKPKQSSEPNQPPAQPADDASSSSVAPPWFTSAMGSLNANIDQQFNQLNLRLTRIEDHLNVESNED